MSKIIVCIHGLGNKPPLPLLKKWWRESLQEGFKRIGQSELLFKMEMVYWSDILHPQALDPAITDKEDPLYISEPYFPVDTYEHKKSGLFRKKILDYLEKQLDKLFLSENNTIDLSSLSDIIIHKYFVDLEMYYSTTCLDKSKGECLARNIIRERLISILKKHQGKEILLIAHSMGTIISYDVLAQSANNINVNTFITIGSALGIPVIMKKIANEQGINLKNGVGLNTPENVTDRWLNFSDLRDKVAINYNLNDDYGANSKGIKPEDFVVYNDYKIDDNSNPHKIYGYLRTPELAEIVYEFLTRERSKMFIWFNKRVASIVERII